jgi:glycosyltransferase involved in cell wall biosynthesis
MSFSISVLTPTWNRAPYLHQVWEGLMAQSYRNFEWIVGNDGSEDDTIEIVHALASKSDFPIILISASKRVGKSRIDNEAVSEARGDFIIWCDSDDFFFPQALQTLIDTWEGIPVAERDSFCGVSALCDTENGVLGTRFYDQDEPTDLIWNQMYHYLRADLVIFTRSDLVKKNPFPEVDFLISESSVWSKIGVLKTRFIPIVLERKRYGETNALSHSGHMSYNRGHAYSIALTKKIDFPYLHHKERLTKAINFLRYCWHGEISFDEVFQLWTGNKLEVVVLLLLWPYAFALAIKDELQGKVRKTHRDFLEAQGKAIITRERLTHIAKN